MVSMPGRRDRRWNRRLEVLERIEGRVVPQDVPIAILNLSRGGFLVQAPIDFPIGSIQKFRFSVAAAEPITLHAQVIHARRASAVGTASYVIGLEFADGSTPIGARAIDTLMQLGEAMALLIDAPL
jgi:hypothetical protein